MRENTWSPQGKKTILPSLTVPVDPLWQRAREDTRRLVVSLPFDFFEVGCGREDSQWNEKRVKHTTYIS